ncbi:MAG: UDP-N-acetylmuramoyl-L-alanine--D-glutamate ligase [Candidatus Anammoxibacter sp.]
MSIINELEKKSVLILGMGKEGVSTYAYIRKRFPDKQLGLADKNSLSQLESNVKELVVSDKQVELFLGDEYLESIAKHDVIFKSPGISPFLPELVGTERSGTRISSNTEMFFENCPGKIIGVTGTKGKSTTSSLIYEVLKAGGYDVRLVGNIGLPPLSALHGSTAKTIFVAELSSYQLMNLKKSPHIAVLLNIVREHLDYHKTFEAYVKAKQTITQFQLEDDYLIYNSSYPIPADIASISKAKKVPFGFKRTGRNGCFIENDFLVYQSNGKDERIIQKDNVPLNGEFNLQNVMPSILIGKHFTIPNKTIANAIQSYKPLEHRLEFVGVCNGVSFYNDSLSTIPEATIAAINALQKNQIVLIAGGLDRGQDFRSLAKAVLDNNIKAVVLFPSTGERLLKEIVSLSNGNDNMLEHIFVKNMQNGVNEAYNFAEDGDIILLSPGSASFGCFKDYTDRGNQFKKEIKILI